MTELEVVGLEAFVFVVVTDLLALLVDAYLALSGRETITHRVRTRWRMAAILVAWQLLGAAGLAIHFWM